MGKEYLVLQVKYEEGIGKMFGTFILIQNLCHEDLPILLMGTKNDGEYILLMKKKLSQV
jgi:hypothetical protein